MACNNHIINLMHKYLDGELDSTEEQNLKEHLLVCEECQQHFHELKRTVALLDSNNHLQVSSDFTSNVMSNLPKETKKNSYLRWFKAHPIITAAAIFFIFMFGGVMSAWQQDHQVTVSKDKNVVIEEGTVIVPEGVTVEGDLVVKNGDLKIDGEVEGDVTIINGEHLLASAGQISGEIEQVNQVFDWIWYNIKDIAKNIFSMKE
ncbi:anti-sigma factor family protein [Aquibacillus sediminis]|uniref:anti-sigma factor family protein n=1 Tax=Aquibacillus sediminis TaxID=2574734 RepID=UPI001108CD0B|nr:anti-sigma factor [Aquibacillus sediminis]